MKQFFFDDEKIFGRDNVVRRYGKAEWAPEAIYSDGITSTDLCSCFAFKCADGNYRLLYMGRILANGAHGLFIAVSPDGINFKPENIRASLPADGEMPEHQIMKIDSGEEIMKIFEDIYAPAQERYKMLMTRGVDGELRQEDILFTSPNLLHWTLQEGVCWGCGSEPVGGAFYNQRRNCYTVITRPDWGLRRAGYIETPDWKTFSEFSPCMQVDSLDEPLCEIYGMPAYSYEGIYIGFPHFYRDLESSYQAKFSGGGMEVQLAYSYDGRYWLRTSRETFLGGRSNFFRNEGREMAMFWLPGMSRAENGDILLYALGSPAEHGYCFHCADAGRIFVYRLRQDGFVGLATSSSEQPGRVITREKIWQGGELSVNLCANHATVAVLDSTYAGDNALAIARPLEGYGHEDCIAFHGDNTDWIPEYTSGKSLNNLAGHTLVFEVLFSDGTLYSIEGNFVHASNTQAARYRKFGILPVER